MNQSVTLPDEPERWLPVIGYEGFYEVSDWGRVRSLDRVTPSRNQWGTHGRRFKGRLLRQTFTSFGYPKVAFSVNGEHTYHRVHHLVLEAFAGPCPEGMEALHGPGGSQDNHWLPDGSGLHWGTHSENMNDRTRDGTSNRGEQHGAHKLTRADVIEIRARLKNGETHRAIAESFGIAHQTVGNIRSGRSWGWLTAA